MMVEKLDSLVMDVETAFLNGEIEEEIFIKLPVGMDEIDPGSSPEDCYQLLKAIYGLCQAAPQFWKTLEKQQSRNLLDSKLALQIPVCYLRRMSLGCASL